MKNAIISLTLLAAATSAVAGGLDPEIMAYAEKSVAADRAANEDPNNVHGQAFWNNLVKRCAVAVKKGHNASFEILQASNIVMPPSVWSAQDAVYIKACQGGFEAGQANNIEDFRQAYERFMVAKDQIKTKADALKIANDIGVMTAYSEGFKVAAGTYPNVR
ncbi:hypothetical protein UXN85_20715 [Enterobacter hormaechei]